MTTSRTIVVGYDGSEASRAAVEAAIERAGSDGRIVLVHSYDIPPDYMGAPYYQDMLSHEAKRSQDTMRELAERYPSLADAQHEAEQIPGDPAQAILQVADVQDADEIVLGSHGRGRIGSLVLGSVAQKVIHEATCPVLVMPERMIKARGSAPPVVSATA